MKRQIRRGTFETNSSSLHALCISENSYYPTNLPDVIYFGRGEYGWPFDVLQSVDEKASYLYEAILRYDYKEEMLERLEGILSNYGVQCLFDDCDTGYISLDISVAWVEELLYGQPDKLITYLFGDSFVLTGNDNDDRVTDYLYGDGWMDDTVKPEFAHYDVQIM